MNLERTASGVEVRLKMVGIGRFFSAAFLSVWLAGWAVGEAVVLWILILGGRALLTGHPPGPGRQPLTPGIALLTGLFLLFWLSLWTLGGVMAIRELLRLLFGCDLIRVNPEGLEIERRYGLFRSRERMAREVIRRFYRISPRKGLSVETTRGTSELTRLGTPSELAQLEEALNQEFHLSADVTPEGALPSGWCELVSPEHDPVLVKDPVARRKQARVMWAICACFSLLALLPLSDLLRQPSRWSAVAVLVPVAMLTAWGSIWLSFGRQEWRLDRGRVILQRRFGLTRTARFEGVSLELVENNSGDDGPSYEVTALAANAPSGQPTYLLSKHRRIIYSQSDDPTVPRRFGVWLGQRCRIPFTDRSTAQAKAIEIEELKRQLADSGPLGRVALRVVERLAPTKRDSST